MKANEAPFVATVVRYFAVYPDGTRRPVDFEAAQKYGASWLLNDGVFVETDIIQQRVVLIGKTNFRVVT